MSNPSMIKIKQHFLKKWLVGLQACTSSFQNMNFLERKRAIKMAADLAMASARNGTTCWSQGIIDKSAEDDTGQALIKTVLEKQYSFGRMRRRKKMFLLKKINGRVCRHRARENRYGRSKALAARSIARRMTRKRTKVLRNLVPGGEFMKDEVSLIEETLDYMLFLKAQVDVMRSVVNEKTKL